MKNKKKAKQLLTLLVIAHMEYDDRTFKAHSQMLYKLLDSEPEDTNEE